MVYFCVTALDMLEALDEILKVEKKMEIIEWLYNNQITSDKAFSWRHCGFKGGTFVGQPYEDERGYFSHDYDHSHIAQTYSALAILRSLGDDFTRVDRAAVLRAVGGLQQANGRCGRTRNSITVDREPRRCHSSLSLNPSQSFAATSDGSECDMRFLYCACAICTFLDDWSTVDTDLALSYINSCKSFDGGFGLLPQQESHGKFVRRFLPSAPRLSPPSSVRATDRTDWLGRESSLGGSTFCATAALVLMGRLEECLPGPERDDLVRWCLQRQVRSAAPPPARAPLHC